MDELEAELSDTQIAEKLKLLANELVAELSKCKDFPLLSQLEESTENNSNSSSCETYLTKPGNRADAIPPTFGEAVDDSEGNADALDQGIEIRGGITQDEIPCDAENSSPGGSTREITSNSLHLVDSDIASPIAVPENNISQKIQEERNDSYQCNERRDSSKHPNEKTTSRRRKKVLCICGKLFHTWYLKHHLRSCRGKNEGDPYIGKRVSCPECGRTIAASSLLRHKKSCKHKFLSNISVPDKCVHPSSNFAHYMKMHGKPCQAVLVNSFREFVPCPKCRIKVKKQNLFSHMKNSCKAKKLLLLNNCFPNKVVLSQPTSQGGGSKVRIQVQCKHCGKHLTMSNFSSHLRTHAEEEPFSRSPLSLSCSLSFDIKSVITRKCTYSPSL